MQKNILDINEITFGEKLKNITYFERKAVYGIVFDEGKVAAVKTPKGYFLPGGGIEKNENHTQCLEREFMEEAGYEIEVGRYIGRSSLYHRSKSKRYIYAIGFFYYASLKDKINDGIEDDHELIWMDPKECISSLALEHQSWAVSKSISLSR
ncbi:MAG TPA: DNA mismatch repair protein MutT [Clostridiales bacterium]|nr:DNA mismatch repair protein MutT [Clostridiales bacterium]